MLNTPEISVIIDNYNYAQFLSEAIESVLSQTFTDFELIIVDDGSTDNSRDIIESYCDRRIIKVYKENGGQTSAFNAGFKTASGRVIAFLDSDDYWYPDKLEIVVAAHKKGANIIQHYLSENGKSIYREITQEVDWSSALTRYGYMYQHSPTSALSFCHEVLVPFFPLADSHMMRGHADGCILMLAMTCAKVACLDEVLGVYRVHGSNLNAHRTDSGKAMLDISIIQREFANRQLEMRGLPKLPYDNGLYIKHLLSEVDFGDMPVVVYGTGNSGIRVRETLEQMKIAVWGIANSSGSGNAVSPSVLSDHRNEFGKIIIASSAQNAIEKTLIECGFVTDHIVRLPI